MRHLNSNITRMLCLTLVAAVLAACNYKPQEMRGRDPRPTGHITSPTPDPISQTVYIPIGFMGWLPVTMMVQPYPVDPIDPATGQITRDCIYIAQVFPQGGVPPYQRLMIDFKPTGGGGAAEKIGIVTWIIRTVRQSLGYTCPASSSPSQCRPKGIEAVYKAIVNSAWKRIVYVSMMLVIIFYGISLVFGAVNPSPYQVFIVVFKMVVAWFLLGSGDKSWDNFAYYVYETVETFVNSMTSNLSMMFGGSVVRNPIVQTTENFNVADELLSKIFNFNFVKLSLALSVTGWFGWAYAAALLGAMVAYIMAMIFAIRVFLMALIARNVLYALAPIFVSFILFKETKSLFDNWIAQLISFTLQPIMVFAFLGMFHEIMFGFFAFILQREQGGMVCYMPLGQTMMGGKQQDLYFWQIVLGNDPTKPPLSGPFSTPPVDMLQTFSLIVIMGALTQMMRWTEVAAYRISGGFTSAMNQFPSTWDSFMRYRKR